MIFNASNAARIFDTTFRRIGWVREFFNAVLVWVKGSRPRFVSKKLFYAAFVAFRKAGAQTVRTRQLNVTNFQALGSRGDVYDIETTTDAVRCTCADYEKQIEQIGRGCCKHGYAVLGQLGHSDLRSYIAANS